MTESQELRFPYTDLTVISVRCKRCGAETTVNLADQRQRQLLGQPWIEGPAGETGRSLKCGFCDDVFSPPVWAALRAFVLWLSNARESGAEITVRVVLPTPETE